MNAASRLVTTENGVRTLLRYGYSSLESKMMTRLPTYLDITYND